MTDPVIPSKLPGAESGVDPFDEAFLGGSHELPSSHISEQIRQRCTHDLKAVRPWSRARRVQAGSALCVGMSILLGFALCRHHHTSLPKVLAAVVWLSLVPITLSKGVSDCRYETRTRRWAWALLVPVLFLLYLGACSESHLPFEQFVADPGSRSRALTCTVLSLCTGIGAFAGTMHLWRRTDPFNPQLSGALIGLVGGVSGAIACGIMCPVTESWHLLLAHGFAVVALTALGMVGGRRVLCP